MRDGRDRRREMRAEMKIQHIVCAWPCANQRQHQRQRQRQRLIVAAPLVAVTQTLSHPTAEQRAPCCAWHLYCDAHARTHTSLSMCVCV